MKLGYRYVSTNFTELRWRYWKFVHASIMPHTTVHVKPFSRLLRWLSMTNCMLYLSGVGFLFCKNLIKGGKVCIRANWSIEPVRIFGSSTMRLLEVFPLPPGWDVSPSQGYHTQVPSYTPGRRETLWECLAKEQNSMSPGAGARTLLEWICIPRSYNVR